VIGFLRGVVVASVEGRVILDVAGVGYEFAVTDVSVVPGAEMSFFIASIARDGGVALFGFTDLEERSAFHTIVDTPGVGPSTAMAVLRTLGRDGAAHAAHHGDMKAFTRVPGVGTKTAERLVMELRRLPSVAVVEAPAQRDLHDALLALGYSAPEVARATEGLPVTDEVSTLLPLALKKLSQR
jgi:Holliday junction DNA helicase RuvA